MPRFWTDGALPIKRPFAKNYGMGGASHMHKQAAVHLAIALQPFLAPQQCQLFMGYGTDTQDTAMLAQAPDISLICPQHHEYLFFDHGQQLVAVQTHDLTTGQWTQYNLTQEDNLTLAEIPETFLIKALFIPTPNTLD
jgi:hypothetical protein